MVAVALTVAEEILRQPVGAWWIASGQLQVEAIELLVMVVVHAEGRKCAGVVNEPAVGK